MQEADRFAIDDLAGHDLPDGTVVARNRRSSAQMALPGQVFNAITHCVSFRTMEEHIANLAGPQARGREGEIRQILQSVIDGGLMLSASAIAARLDPQGNGGGAVVREAELSETKSAEAALPVAAVITCERPQALSRLLESMIEHCDLERVERVVVVDDSRREESLAANRRAIDEASERLGRRGLEGFQHFTPADAASLADSLLQRLPDHKRGIRLLLDRRGREEQVTTGITRNIAQLLGPGHPLMVFDDDVLCSVMDPPERESGVEFSARQRGCHFYTSDAEWEDRRNAAQPCPIQAHLQVLGSTLCASLSAIGLGRPAPSAFEFATPGFARRLQPDARVLISQCGSFGDPGSAGNEWIALLPEESRAQLASITGNIESALEDRNCWLGRSRPVFEPRANMSQLTGFDNRAYLPPYFPLFRGQDRAFGAMTEFLHPDSLAADLPFALPHLPIPRRAWREGHRRFNLPFSLTHFLNDYVTGQVPSCGARDVMIRNDWLAMLYCDLADSPRERIVEITAAAWTQKRMDWLARLAEAVDESSSGPTHLTAFLRGALEELRGSEVSALRSLEFKGPPPDLKGEEVLEYWRSAWRDFAAGLRAWPAVRRAVPEILAF